VFLALKVCKTHFADLHQTCSTVQLWSQLGVEACHTAVQTCHHQTKDSLTCSCLSSFQLQSRVSPCGGGSLSLHWKRRNKWTQIKTYTTAAVLKADILDLGMCGVVEALHKNGHLFDTKVLSTSNYCYESKATSLYVFKKEVSSLVVHTTHL